MPTLRRARSWITAVSALVVTLVTLGACAGRQAVGSGPTRQPTRQPTGRMDGAVVAQPVNLLELYRGMGLIAARGAIPYVARVAFLPDASPDSTLVLISLSFAPRSLGFAREGEQYLSSYAVRVEVRDGPQLVRAIEAAEPVRVATFRETTRADESIIWQQYLRVAPGSYAMGIGVRDEASGRASAEEVSLTVPSLPGGQLGSPIPVYDVVPRSSMDSLPRMLARPRATVTFGADSLVPVYLEIAGTRQATRVRAEVIGESNTILWRDSTILLGRGGEMVTGTLLVPAADIGVGVVTLRVSQSDGADTVATKLLVTLGDDLPVADFDEMVRYLRYFATDFKLDKLRNSVGAERAQAWREFLRSTDPVPGTSEHEGLRDYFARIRLANQRFRDDGPVGWLSDRGMAFVGLGDPDNIYEPNITDITQRNRQQVWEYRQWRLQLVFFDQTGLGRWRLSPSASVDLQATIRRRLAEMP